ncbi:hypothetical protein AB0K21_21795 [Streptosporangium sp. NPDC049248]|uniref:hypothetical protein n=1 Tax=Streptosporangium sp. NPDC049248 TaxID=3155651 RepID=UPI0034219923
MNTDTVAIIVVAVCAVAMAITWGACHAIDARAAVRERDEARAQRDRYEEFVNNLDALAKGNRDDYFARVVIGQVRVFHTSPPQVTR